MGMGMAIMVIMVINTTMGDGEIAYKYICSDCSLGQGVWMEAHISLMIFC